MTAPARLQARGRARPGYCRVAKPEVAPGQPYNSVASRIMEPTDDQTLSLSLYITLLYILDYYYYTIIWLLDYYFSRGSARLFWWAVAR